MMDVKLLCVLLIYGLRVALCFHTVIYEYHFINVGMTWPNAQAYCRQHYDDLATFRNTDDINSVKRPSGYSYAWIGLFDDPASWYRVMGTDSNSWRWSATGTISTSRYQTWTTGEPDFYHSDNTCVIAMNGAWGDNNCAQALYFVCFRGSLQPGSKEFILGPTKMSWSEAVVYCREHYVDLAVIEDASEQQTVANMVGSNWAWIGLSREPWRWSDNRTSLFKNWINGEPDNKGGNEHCVVEYSDTAHHWLDASCSALVPFICQQALKTKTALVKIELQSAVDLSNPDINAQIINQVSAMFKDLGLTDFKLSWKISPVKEVS